MRIGLDGISQGSGVDEGAGAMESILPDLYGAIARIAPEHEFVIFAARHAAVFRSLGGPNLRVVPCAVSRRRPLRVAYEQFRVPMLARRFGLDAYYAATNVLPLRLGCATVLVINALQCFAFPEDFGAIRRRYLQTLVPLSLRRATRIVAVSNFIAAEAVRYCGVDPWRFDVVPHGSWENVRRLAGQPLASDVETVSARYYSGGPYILAVSRFYFFKNLPRLIAAFAMLKTGRRIPHRLVIVGADADVTARDLEQVARAHGVGHDVVFIGAVPNRDVAALYRKADAFVHPSLYETFGVTSLEAMVCGCPVVAANAAAIPEVTGDAALLVDPEDVPGMAEAIYRVLTDRELRDSLIARGYRKAAEYSTDREAKETVAVIERAVGGGRPSGAGAYTLDAGADRAGAA
jgi:glycosyltransferase involved in cell wall biosynthesis